MLTSILQLRLALLEVSQFSTTGGGNKRYTKKMIALVPSFANASTHGLPHGKYTQFVGWGKPSVVNLH